MNRAAETIVEMRGVTKRFGEVVANNLIDFDLKRGEIHALLGENGAGKTTLMNILSGMFHPDEGEIYIKGKKVQISSPSESLALGIGMVYQHLTLVPTLSVMENIFLGTSKKQFLLKKDAKEKVKKITDSYGLDIDLDIKIWQLSAGEQAKVEIVKLFYRGSDILILDEPTSFLSPVEIEDFFEVLKSMTELGKSVIFITHKVEEALAISDRITVLRQGENCGEIDLEKTEVDKKGEKLKRTILEMMFKEEASIAGKEKKVKRRTGRVVLKVEGVTAENDRGMEALKRISFTIHEGEVFGIAGVDGNGQKELAEVIAGQRKALLGSIILNNEDITNMSVRAMNSRGVFYVTDDRIAEGSVADFSLAENAIFRCYRKEPYARRGLFLNSDAIKRYSDSLIRVYSIKASNSDAPVRTLSGGNIQKLILAREFSYNPAVLVCNKPTHGLDVVTTDYIRHEIRERAKSGVSVLLISTDLDEIKEVSDRIGIMFRGELIRIVPAIGTTKEEIGRLMSGIMN